MCVFCCCCCVNWMYTCVFSVVVVKTGCLHVCFLLLLCKMDVYNVCFLLLLLCKLDVYMCVFCCCCCVNWMYTCVFSVVVAV